VQRPSEDGNLLGQRTRSPVPDPDFIAVVAHVLMPPLAPAAAAIAHHHVAHDAATDPRGVHALADGCHHARPLMTEAHRIGRMPRVEIGHLAGEELNIGAADSNPFDMDDDLARAGRRCRHILHRTLFRRSQDIRAHDPGAHRTASMSVFTCISRMMFIPRPSFR
jgi:hypothetical protein